MNPSGPWRTSRMRSRLAQDALLAHDLVAIELALAQQSRHSEGREGLRVQRSGFGYRTVQERNPMSLQRETVPAQLSLTR